MTKTAPHDIEIISDQELHAMKLVTDDIYSEEWSYELVEGQPYLKGDQVSRRGENKLIFACERNGSRLVPVLFALSELPDHALYIEINPRSYFIFGWRYFRPSARSCK